MEGISYALLLAILFIIGGFLGLYLIKDEE